MITGSVSIVGEPFKKYVADQIDVRQSIYGSGITQDLRTDQQIQYLNGKNAWVKMASSVKIDENEGSKKLIDIGFTETQTKQLLGTKLAEQFILFNGTSALNNPLQREGVSNTQNMLDTSVYGTLGVGFGLQAMPGIQSFTVAHANRGSIRTGQITIRANSEQQFNVLELLYIRLGYTMLVEWGSGMYFDNQSEFQQMGPSLVDDGTWFNENGTTHLQFFDKIEKKRQDYQGNYDAFFCKVSNFSWKFNSSGYYEITLDLVSLGDIVESFRINTLPQDSIIPQGDQDGTQENEINKNAISNKLYCARKDAKEDTSNINTEIDNSDYVSVFPLEEGKGLKIKQFGVDPNKLYYIRFGTFLEFLEQTCIDYIQNGDSLLFPEIEFNTSLQNYMRIFPGLVSTNPLICYIDNILPRGRDGEKIGIGPDIIESTKYFKRINEQVDDNHKGHIMNIYLNFDFIDEILESKFDPETGKLDLFSFLKSICEGINSCFGGYIKLVSRLSNSIIFEITDDFLEVRTGADGSPIPEEDTSPEIMLYGIEDSGKSNFVRDFSFETKITNDIATTISIGATANNESTAELSDFFKTLNKGLIDRFKESRTTGNPEKTDLYKIQCAENNEKKELTKGQILWEAIKNALWYSNPAILSTVSDPKAQEEISKSELQNDNYVEYLENMFGKQNGNLPRYFQYKNSDISRGNSVLSEFIRSFYQALSKATDSKVMSSNIGFIPIEIDITLDGISGIKIYNQLKADTRFLPRDYPNVVEFIISGVQHTISDNQWTTTLSAISKPSKNLAPVTVKSQQSQQRPGDVIVEVQDEVPADLFFYPPTNNINVDAFIRVDSGGDGNFGASRGGRSHDGIDLETITVKGIYSPIPGRIEITRATVKSKLKGFKIIGEGEYKGYIAYVFYCNLQPNIQPGQTVPSGLRVATAADLSIDYPKEVTNHVHFAVKKNGTPVDPSNLTYSLIGQSV